MEYIEFKDGKDRIDYYEIENNTLKVYYQDETMKIFPYSRQKEQELLNIELNQMKVYLNSFQKYDFDWMIKELKLLRLKNILFCKYKKAKEITEEIAYTHEINRFISIYTLYIENMDLLNKPIQIVNDRNQEEQIYVTPNNIEFIPYEVLNHVIVKRKQDKKIKK